jgi:hypothetical protein
LVPSRAEGLFFTVLRNELLLAGSERPCLRDQLLWAVEAVHPFWGFNHNSAILEDHVLAVADLATDSDFCARRLPEDSLEQAHS